MSISISRRKEKAKELQRWVCEKISQLTGLRWGVSGDDAEIESRPMGQTGTDVRLGEQARKLFPFSVECKRAESWGVPAWVEQAKENQLPGTDWLLIVKRSRRSPIAIMDAERFFDLCRIARSLNDEESRHP